MSAPFILPFNFQPQSTTFKAQSFYTIPAGFYAEVFDIGGDLQINSNPVNLFTSINGTMVSGGSITFDIYSESIIYIIWSISGSGVDTFQITGYTTFGRTDGVTNSGVFWLRTKPGTSTATMAAVSTNDTLTYTIQNFRRPEGRKIWVKSGDILFGFYYGVTLYPEIS